MVRFINKNLKAHSYSTDENVREIMDIVCLYDLADLFAFHLRDFSGKTNELVHLLQKTTIQLKLNSPADLKNWIAKGSRSTKDIFLLIELILETYVKNKYLEKGEPQYILDFIDDVNEFFLINKIPLQIRYFQDKKEFYVEKIISPEISEKIKETLENFSKEEKVFEDFKEAIKQYSSGDYEGSIERCCVSIEDYLCIILGKKSCQSVDRYYKEASKKLKIPKDIHDRFVNSIHYIHNHRSPQNHGAIEKKIIKDEELVSEIVIGFTMIILNYLKKKNEKS